MPVAKSAFEELYPCDFYTPGELLEPEQMYNVYEIARLLQGLSPDAEIDQETEQVLLDWAIPWVMVNADDLVIAEPPSDEEPGYYGLAREEDLPAVTRPAEGGDGDGDDGREDDGGGGEGDDDRAGDATRDER